MIELQTEVCLATVQLFLEKKPEERNEKLTILCKESMNILETKQDQFSTADKKLYQRALNEIKF